MINNKEQQQPNETGPRQEEKKGIIEPITLNDENGNQLTEEDADAEQQRKEALTERY